MESGSVERRDRYVRGQKAWSRPPEYPYLKVKSYSRYHDMTFSLGRETSHAEVESLLIKAGCFEAGKLHDYVKQIRITGNRENGQVFVECRGPGLSDIFVEKINNMDLEHDTIRKCHSYTNNDIPVKFSFIHSSIDIQEEIVNKFLKDYGEVKEWFPVVDKLTKIPTGPYIFIMKDEDLQKRPLPESVFLNHMQTYISYRTQVRRCHNCDKLGHMRRECSEQGGEYPTLGYRASRNQNNNGSSRVPSPFLNGKMPSYVPPNQIQRPSNVQSQSERTDVLDMLGNMNYSNSAASSLVNTVTTAATSVVSTGVDVSATTSVSTASNPVVSTGVHDVSTSATKVSVCLSPASQNVNAGSPVSISSVLV